jgi:hypothetical protein
MANIIKIKRGLKASIPALAIGELAYCTDTNELFIGVNTGTISEPVLANVLINEVTDLSDFYTKSEIEALAGLGIVWNSNTDKFDADLATQGEAEAGTDNTVLMTPLRTKEAIDEQTGTILTSANYVAFGDLASQQDAEDGTLNDVWMSPLRTAQAIAELSSAVTISTTAPTNPKEGDLWWDSSDGTLYIYFDPNGTAIWVEVTFGDTAAQLFLDSVTIEGSDSKDFPPTTLNVTNDGSGAYVINESSNPTLTVVRGETYTFNINAAGHPFHIQTVAGAYSSGDLYTTGITNAGTADGVITWVVDSQAPSTLYYVCQFHSSMQGTINVVDSEDLDTASK